MDAHPIDLADLSSNPEEVEVRQDEEQAEEVSELSKAKFVKPNPEELQEIIKQKSKTINAAVAISEEKQRNIIIFDAETLSKDVNSKDEKKERDKEIPPSQALATLRVESAANFFSTISEKLSDKNDQPDEEGRDYNTLVYARTLCKDYLERWVMLLDNATYMPGEHMQKEKEYGIKWRTAFKDEIRLLLTEEQEGKIDDEEKFDFNLEDPFVYLHRMIKKNITIASEKA